MRLTEFVNQKILKEVSKPSWDEAVEILTKNGYKQIGFGIHAEIFFKEGSTNVLKLFSNDDDGYKAFLQLMTSHPNTHFPKLVGKLTKINDDYSAIRMEKLDPISNFPDWFTGTLSVYEEARQEDPNRASKSAEEIMAGHYSRHDDETELLNLFKTQPGLEEALNLIIDELVIKQGRSLDLHKKNIMSRNGTWVIIDTVH